MCDFSFGRGRSYRPRTLHPIDTLIRPVFGRTTVFSIPHAALAAGLLDPPMSAALSWESLMGAAKSKWGRSAEEFLRDAANAGVTMASVRGAASRLPHALIGWPRQIGLKKSDSTFGLCSDLALTLAVMSHRAGNLILRSRQPYFSWVGLFGGIFEVDEPISRAPLLSSEPWSGFRWEDEQEVSHEYTT